ncbi:MAG: hypothetical protein WC846_02260 [Candidatus Gracilibacteria bacterium]|jgi:hypothetical protein
MSESGKPKVFITTAPDGLHLVDALHELSGATPITVEALRGIMEDRKKELLLVLPWVDGLDGKTYETAAESAKQVLPSRRELPYEHDVDAIAGDFRDGDRILRVQINWELTPPVIDGVQSVMVGAKRKNVE